MTRPNLRRRASSGHPTRSGTRGVRPGDGGSLDSLILAFRAMHSALVSDCAEAEGLGVRAAAAGLLPMHSDQLTVAVGWAYPVAVHRTSEYVEITRLLEMVRLVPDGSIVVVASDQTVECALWGGLMTESVRGRGCVGAVVDGGVRDLAQILPTDFPVWATSRSPLDIRGRAEVVTFNEPVVFRGVPVQPGDLVIADANGVVVVPREAAAAVLRRCQDRLETERESTQELAAGEDPVSVYRRRGAF